MTTRWTVVDPPIDVLASYVVRVAGPDPETGRPYVTPGSFYEALVTACFRADRGNRARLAEAYPLLVDMVRAYKDDTDGVARLRAAVKTGDW